MNIFQRMKLLVLINKLWTQLEEAYAMFKVPEQWKDLKTTIPGIVVLLAQILKAFGIDWTTPLPVPGSTEVVSIANAITVIAGALFTLFVTSKGGGAAAKMIVIGAILFGLFAPVTVQAADIEVLPNMNLQGDVAYLFTHKGFAAGAGIDLAKAMDGMFSLRAEALGTAGANEPSKGTIVGAAIMMNLPKLAERLKIEWVAKAINPSVGVFGGYDLNNSKTAVGMLATIVKLEW